MHLFLKIHILLIDGILKIMHISALVIAKCKIKTISVLFLPIHFFSNWQIIKKLKIRNHYLSNLSISSSLKKEIKIILQYIHISFYWLSHRAYISYGLSTEISWGREKYMYNKE